MVLDTSAIIATIANEADSLRFRTAMLGAERLGYVTSEDGNAFALRRVA